MAEKVLSDNSIQDFLGHRTWSLELEIGDFVESKIADFLQLPDQIFNSNPKAHFWAFLQCFLEDCAIGFIKRELSGAVDIALLGFFEGESLAIPLWILAEGQDLLLGFEVIDSFEVMDAEPLRWHNALPEGPPNAGMPRQALVIVQASLFQHEKIYFKISNGFIMLDTEYFNELEFLTRIAHTRIPEFDDVDDFEDIDF